MTRIIPTLLLGAAAAAAFAVPASGQIVLSRSVVGAGGGATSGAISSLSTVGQAVIGMSQGAALIVCHGFWCGSALNQTGVPEEVPPGGPGDLPVRWALGAPWPNPSRGRAQFSLALPAASSVRVTVLDVNGRLVSVALDAALAAGRYILPWDGRGERGQSLAAGVYYALLEVDGRAVDRKSLVVIK